MASKSSQSSPSTSPSSSSFDDTSSEASLPTLKRRKRMSSGPERKKEQACKDSLSRQNCPNVIEFLMSDLTQPSSLMDISARSLAQYYNNVWELPPLGWVEIVECLVLIHLTSVLFIKFLRFRGGVKQLYEDYSSVNFQRILKKIFHIYYDLPRMPLRIKSFVTHEMNQFSMIMLQSEKTEHALHRLGLGYITQLDKAEKMEDGRIDEENARIKLDIDFNHRLLRFYRNWQRQIRQIKTSMPLSLPISPRFTSFIGWHSPFCELSIWIERKQETFRHANTLPSMPMRNFDVLQNFLILNPTSKCYELLLAVDTAVQKKRHHCAAFLSVYLLETSMGVMRQIKNIKIYVLATLAVSLAVFNCRMDVAIEMIRRMNHHIIYDSDKGLVLLTKMKVLQTYGYAFKVNSIFEYIQNKQIFHKRSHYYFEAVVVWSNALLDRCFNLVLELWLAKKERNRHTENGETSKQKLDNNNKVNNAAEFRLSRCKNALSRLLESLKEEPNHFSPETTSSNAIPELLLRRSMVMGLIECLMECQRPSTLRMWSRAIADTPFGLTSSPYTELLRAYCNRAHRPATIKDFRNERSAMIRCFEIKSDWSQNPQVACANFEMLTFLCVSDLQETSAPSLTQDIFEETLSCYQHLSHPSYPLPRLVLLQRMKQFFNKVQLKAPAHETIGMCDRQLKQNVFDQNCIALQSSSQRACRDLNDLEALKWYILREENSRIKTILTFGFNSVTFQNGT